ncbi:hypothetical protein GCM10010324_25700 [Streptomyces hiroshimensis]|uniref:Uncharacterized protein n=1 Tax=Streptomyces hiroshimensis TaxID=66424 RepID=A0ABQ2YBH6_9ACTN|nr:hypothetical protein GCM10010324_25700 [Streptomyces hiroshimensis]
MRNMRPAPAPRAGCGRRVRAPDTDPGRTPDTAPGAGHEAYARAVARSAAVNHCVAGSMSGSAQPLITAMSRQYRP